MVSRITHLKLNGEEKLEVFLCIDIHTNLAISYLVTQALEKCIKERFIMKPYILLIIIMTKELNFQVKLIINHTIL